MPNEKAKDLLFMPLYVPADLTDDDADAIDELRSGGITMDFYCPECSQDATFRRDVSRGGVPAAAKQLPERFPLD